MSMQIDLPAGDYTMISFDGAWIRERYQHERKLTAGECSIGSICGTSSNRHNPFFAIRAIGNFHLYMRPFPLIFRPPIQKLKTDSLNSH